ncbi:MAG: hypothetical protein U5K69_15330 [Balneolaceae bacterium]|nr:hypothetical protein [Balneolaceae bacterium]
MFLILIMASNVLAPPPESVNAIVLVGHLQWIFIGLAYWVDKHRTIKK